MQVVDVEHQGLGQGDAAQQVTKRGNAQLLEGFAGLGQAAASPYSRDDIQAATGPEEIAETFG